MSQGPIIISDDGSPPPLHGPGVRVTRVDSRMDELPITKHHPVIGTAIDHVEVTINKGKPKPYKNVTSVSAEGRTATIQVKNTNGDVHVFADKALTPDVAGGFYRYGRGDPSILKVQISGYSDIDNSSGNDKIRIDIKLK